MAGSILVIGLGDLGFHLLQFLARVPGISKIVTADVNEGIGLVKTRDAIFGASQQGFYPETSFTPIDLYDIEGTSELLHDLNPDVICNVTTLMSWWVRHTLPAETYNKLAEAGSGPWVPMHLSLTYNLMQAIKKSGIDTRVVNCSFPDGVNPVLGKIGLAPTIGGGNTSLLIPPIKMVVAEKLHVPLRAVSVSFVGHHSVVTTGMKAPYWVRIFVDNKDVTELFPKDKIGELVMNARSRGMGATGWSGPPPQQATASSFLRNALAIYFDKHELVHASGPKGLTGGYPVRLSYDSVDVVVPKGLTLDEMVKINEDGAKWDGIEKIKSDGTLVLTDVAARIMRETLGYERSEYKVSESGTIAKELLDIVKKRNMG
jgi:hypothetical protein